MQCHSVPIHHPTSHRVRDTVSLLVTYDKEAYSSPVDRESGNFNIYHNLLMIFVTSHKIWILNAFLYYVIQDLPRQMTGQGRNDREVTAGTLAGGTESDALAAVPSPGTGTGTGTGTGGDGVDRGHMTAGRGGTGLVLDPRRERPSIVAGEDG